MSVDPIPGNVQRVIPYLMVDSIEAELPFVEAVFGADILEQIPGPDNKIMHAEIKIGDSMIMFGSKEGESVPSMLYVYVPDTDAAYHKAIELGATSLMEPADQFYGDRNAGVQDKQGIKWWLASRVENVSPEEMEKRSREWAEKK